ncbi:hypothetical protein [Curtobacterium sp. PhB115]|uniref:hypothetical protein n=1 Tax=Curtobacterium sp. PhB115 TaxID=2485173 RepID=UPI0011CD974B|nr:hypothetical protein [Curtobacterium sp. PhB115]
MSTLCVDDQREAFLVDDPERRIDRDEAGDLPMSSRGDVHCTRDGQAELFHEVWDLIADGIDPDPVQLRRPQQFSPRGDMATSGLCSHAVRSPQYLELRVGAVHHFRAHQIEVIEERDRLAPATFGPAQRAPDETRVDEDDFRPSDTIVELENPVLVECSGASRSNTVRDAC